MWSLGCVRLGWSGTGLLGAEPFDWADLIFERLVHAPAAPSQKIEQPEQFDFLSDAPQRFEF